MLERFSFLIGRIATVGLEDLKREEGQTTVEYAVVIVLVIGMAIVAFGFLSASVSDFMKSVSGLLTNAASGL